MYCINNIINQIQVELDSGLEEEDVVCRFRLYFQLGKFSNRIYSLASTLNHGWCFHAGLCFIALSRKYGVRK